MKKNTIMINLDKLEEAIDEALSKETSESWNKWLVEQKALELEECILEYYHLDSN